MNNKEIDELVSGKGKRPARNVRSKGKQHRGKIYRLFVERLSYNPYYVMGGDLRTTRIAKKLDMSNEGFYRWLRSDNITFAGVRLVISTFKGCFTVKDFLPFCKDIDYDLFPDLFGGMQNLVKKTTVAKVDDLI